MTDSVGVKPDEKAVVASPTAIHKGWKIPLLPPSMNKLYAINYRTRSVYMTPEAREFKTKMKLFITSMPIDSTKKLSLKLDVHTDWYFKNGKPKKSDIQNLIKVVVDALSERLGFDDSLIWSFTANKVQSNESFIWLELEQQ
jgi:Holliday junction resolvase RusA-like endonuclease